MNRKVIIVDDHPVFLEGIKNVLLSTPGFEVEFQANCIADLRKYLNRERPDISNSYFVLDVSLPDGSGFDIIPIITSAGGSASKCTLLSIHDENEYADHAFSLGANGYIVKSDDPSSIIDCLDALANGKRYQSKSIGRSRPSMISAEGLNTPNFDQNIAPDFSILSKREINILRLVSEEKTSKEISDLLSVSPRTVENHRANICNKLGVSGHHGLISLAVKHKEVIALLS